MVSSNPTVGPDPVVGKTPITVPWEKVYVFVSSTFEDMHAERDYLVKNVFPHLQEWCEKRKLRLVDIDLRWGVTEQDALYNKNVVKVCLDRIDECRPFFLCFLGQRRGWVPKEKDISQETYEAFPDLKSFAGQNSVTEIEILHALINPLHQSKKHDPKKTAEYYDRAKYAFFYLREATYLNKMPDDPVLLRQTYTNEGIENKAERAVADQELKRWREVTIKTSDRPVHDYEAKWSPETSTPELIIPLQCPSTEPANIERWRSKWVKAGLTVGDTNIITEETEVKKAKEFNTKLCTGRLTDFKCNGKSLRNAILENLEAAITARYPDHKETINPPDLQKEIDQQNQFLFLNSEGFIKREGDFCELDEYVNGNSNKLFVLTAPGGMGKSMLLANWIDHYRTLIEGSKKKASIHFRFIGASEKSTTVYSLLSFLLQEIKEIGDKLDEPIPQEPNKVLEAWPKLLEAIGKHGKTIIVIDALNQLESGLSEINWLPWSLPPNIKLIVSFKRGEKASEELYERLEKNPQVILSKVKPFESLEDRRELVRAYLSQYLKDLDEQHLEVLIRSPGAGNPLYLKVVLSELRVFGAFSNLEMKIRSDFGETPVSAFQGMLRRLESDPAYSLIDPNQAVPLLFGLLANACHGLSAEELENLFIQALKLPDAEMQREAVGDSIYLLLRQVRSFLARREGRYDFFYESFKIAAEEMYVARTKEEPLPKRLFIDWNCMLAEYFDSLPTWQTITTKLDGTVVNVPMNRKVSELPYHQSCGQMWTQLEKTLSDLDFVAAKCASEMTFELIADYSLFSSPLTSELAQWCQFLQKNAQKLKLHPKMLVALINHEGFAEARNQLPILRWQQPWLRTSPEQMPASKEESLKGLKAQIKRNIKTPDSKILTIAPVRAVAFCFENLGALRIYDTDTMRKTEVELSIRRDRPLTIACAPDASSLSVFYETGVAELFRCILNKEKRPSRLELVTEFSYYMPEIEDPVAVWYGGAFWYQTNANTLACVSVEAAGFSQHELPIGHTGEVSALVFVESTKLVILRDGPDTWLTIPGIASLRKQSTQVASACACGGHRVAVAFTDGELVVYEVDDGLNVKDKKQLGIPEGQMGWDGLRLLWVERSSGAPRFMSWYPEEASPQPINDNEEIFPAQLFFTPKQWIVQQDGSILLGTTLSLVAIDLLTGDSKAEGHLGIQYLSFLGGQLWRVVYKRGEEYLLLEKHPLREVPLGRGVMGRLYCAVDGKRHFLAIDGQGLGLVINLKTLETNPLRGPPGINSAVGDGNGGFWLTDRAGDIYFTDAAGQCRCVARVGLDGVSGSCLQSCGDKLVWFGYSYQYFQETGSETARTFLFFKKGETLKLLSQQFRHPKEGNYGSVCYDQTSNRLVTLWESVRDGFCLRIGSLEEFGRWQIQEIPAPMLNPFGFSQANLSANGRFLGVLNSSGAFSCVSVADGKVKATLAPGTPFVAIAPGGEGSEFWLIDLCRTVYKCAVIEGKT